MTFRNSRKRLIEKRHAKMLNYVQTRFDEWMENSTVNLSIEFVIAVWGSTSALKDYKWA